MARIFGGIELPLLPCIYDLLTLFQPLRCPKHNRRRRRRRLFRLHLKVTSAGSYPIRSSSSAARGRNSSSGAIRCVRILNTHLQTRECVVLLIRGNTADHASMSRFHRCMQCHSADCLDDGCAEANHDLPIINADSASKSYLFLFKLSPFIHPPELRCHGPGGGRKSV